jgi:hypothetical protein
MFLLESYGDLFTDEERDHFLRGLLEAPANLRKEYVNSLKKNLNEIAEVQDDIREYTDESKVLCDQKNWSEALKCCQKAHDLLTDSPYRSSFEWFSHRDDVIGKVIAQLEKKITQDNRSTDQSVTKAENESESDEISDERWHEIQEEMIEASDNSKRFTAVTVKAFIHATDASRIEKQRTELQNEVDEIDDAIIDHHEEENDNILCVESRSSRMQTEKAEAIAFDEDLNKRTFVLVDSQERVISASESDNAVTSDAATELNRVMQTLKLTAAEKRVMEKGIRNVASSNFGNRIRSQGVDGLDESKASFGSRFRANKRAFAEEATEFLIDNIAA